MAKNREETLPATQADVSKFNVVPFENLKDYAFMNRELMEIVEENLAGQGFSPSDFEKIKFPSSGTTFWQRPDLSGKMKPHEELTGMIIMQKYGRAFWKEKYTGGNQPPDCYSRDMNFGVGTPGGACATCPFSKWGSSPQEGSNAKACKEVGMLFLVQPGEGMPIIVPVPPTSLKNIKKFMLKLASQKIKYSHAIVSLGLQETKNAKNIDYSVIDPKLISVLPEEAEALVDDYITKFKASFDAAMDAVTQGDISGEE